MTHRRNSREVIYQTMKCFCFEFTRARFAVSRLFMEGKISLKCLSLWLIKSFVVGGADINHSIAENKFFHIGKKVSRGEKARQRTLAGKFHNQMTFGIVLVLMLLKELKIAKKEKSFPAFLSAQYQIATDLYSNVKNKRFFSCECRAGPKLAIRHLRQTIRLNALDT